MSCQEPSTEHPSRPSASHRLRRKAARSLRASIITALLAVILLVLTTFLLLGCFLARIDPFAHAAIIVYLSLAVPAIPLLAGSSGMLSLRHTTLLSMAKETDPLR